MEIRKAERKNARIKMALQGSAGSGKTYSALLLAYGLCQDWSKIIVIDTENSSADLYSHLGDYKILSLQGPYMPENYIKAIGLCEEANADVIIIDSLSHAWDCLLDIHSNMAGNSFTNWSRITPRQNAFINRILSCNTHVIATMRVKQDYVLNQKDGKYVPEKVGLKAIQRDGVDYEFTLVLDIDAKHHAVTSKDRTGLFINKPEFTITEVTGKTILDWCNSGSDSLEALKTSIEDCESLERLRELYNSQTDLSPDMIQAFTTKKVSLSEFNKVQNKLTLKFNPNGSFTSH